MSASKQRFLSWDDLEMYAALDVVDVLRTAQEQLNKTRGDGHKLGNVSYERLAATKDKAATRAWTKLIKKFPGTCRYLYGNRSEKLKKDMKQFAAAAKHLDAKTEEARKKGIKALATLIMKMSGFPEVSLLAVPWAVDAHWAVVKWQFKAYKKLFSWMARNIEEMGDLQTLREECKKTEPELPDKIKREVKEVKRSKGKSKKKEDKGGEE